MSRRRATAASYGVSEVHQRFIERMRQVRKHRQLSDTELADRIWNASGINLDRATMSKIQNGLRGISLTEAWLVAEALSVPFADMCNPEPLVIETRIEVP